SVSPRAADLGALSTSQCRLKASATLAQVAAQHPEAPERGGQLEAGLGAAGILLTPCERGPQVFVIRFQPVRPWLLLGAFQLRRPTQRQRAEPASMPPHNLLLLH